MKIGIASDHAGLQLKSALLGTLAELGTTYEDLGAFTDASVDYPDYALQVADGVAGGRFDFGVLVCGTGLGMCISANKVPGVRAVTLNDTFSAEMARRHNDANVITLGQRVIGEAVAAQVLKVFLETPFEGGRHQRRVDKMNALDAKRQEPGAC